MSARRISRLPHNQGQGGGSHVHYVRADIVSQKRNERMVREAYRKEHKINSYLAEDENFPSFKTQLAKLGLELRDIPGDGNCLFRALGDQLEGHVRNHFQHRKNVVNYMTEHKHDFEPFLDEDTSFESHTASLQKMGTYAGNDAIVAFSRLHQVNVIIHQLDSPFLLIQGPANPSPTTRQLHIAYHNGDHYSSVRKAGDNTASPTNIRLKIGNDDPQSAGATGRGSSSSSGLVRAVRDTERLAEDVMNATGCCDRQRVLQSLADCDYDVDATIAYLLQTMETMNGFSDDSTSIVSQITSTDSGVWSEGQTTPTKQSNGHRRQESFGSVSNMGGSNGGGGARPKVPPSQPPQKLNGKQSKKLKKMEKKKRAEDKHKLKFLGQEPQIPADVSDDLVTVVARDLQMARI